MIECFFSILTRPSPDAECATLEEGAEGLSGTLPKEIQPKSHPLHLDQRARTLPTHHRGNEKYQAAHAEQPTQRKAKNNAVKN
jgi:hypothetical protein